MSTSAARVRSKSASVSLVACMTCMTSRLACRQKSATSQMAESAAARRSRIRSHVRQLHQVRQVFVLAHMHLPSRGVGAKNPKFAHLPISRAQCEDQAMQAPPQGRERRRAQRFPRASSHIGRNRASIPKPTAIGQKRIPCTYLRPFQYAVRRCQMQPVARLPLSAPRFALLDRRN